MNYNQLIIKEDKTILEALEMLTQIKDFSRLILFVFNKKEKIIGSLTDGDIRRSLIMDHNINKKVSEICNKNFLFKYDTDGYLELKSFYKKDIKIMPLLNKDNTISRFIDLDKTRSLLPLECMIMAGGRGKRLSPLTDTVPKPMLKLNGKPIIEYNIDRLIYYGIKKIYISLNYLGEQIESYFGDGSFKGIEIEYVYEKKQLGTAGALSLVDNFQSENILLMNSDLFTNVDFERLYLKLINENADMVVSSKSYKVDIPFAVLDVNDSNVASFKEKPSYNYPTNAGIYILKKELINLIPNNKFFDITDLMNFIVSNGKKLVHVPITGYWIDIGRQSDYINAQQLIENLK